MSSAAKGVECPNVVQLGKDTATEQQGENVERRPTLFEINATNVIGLAIVGMIGWAGLQISDNNVAVEKQGVLVSELNTEVKSMKATINSQGTAQQILRNDLDHALLRLDKVERQADNMESEVLSYLIKETTTATKGNK